LLTPSTPYVEGSLADRGRPALARALRESIHLARGVEHLHANGVVHTGFDPETVIYPDASLDGLPALRLDHVGLLATFRQQFDPPTTSTPAMPRRSTSLAATARSIRPPTFINSARPASGSVPAGPPLPAITTPSGRRSSTTHHRCPVAWPTARAFSIRSSRRPSRKTNSLATRR
jgi:hypothetical protein